MVKNGLFIKKKMYDLSWKQMKTNFYSFIAALFKKAHDQSMKK